MTITTQDLTALSENELIQEFVIIKNGGYYYLTVLLEDAPQYEFVLRHGRRSTKTYRSAETVIRFLHALHAQTIEGEDVPIRFVWQFF